MESPAVRSEKENLSLTSVVTEMVGDLFGCFIDLLGALFTQPHVDKLREISLDEMIHKSKLVIVGKVIGIKQITIAKEKENSPFDEERVARVMIEKIIVGGSEEKHIDITYYPRMKFEARFWESERCLLFVCERNLIVNGYAGKIPIKKDNVEVRYILGEQRRQRLKDFINRIRDCEPRQAVAWSL